MSSSAMSPNQREGITAQSSITGFNEYITSTNGALNVNASFTPPALQDVNLTKVGGTAIALGQTTMSASIPVTLASNQSALAVSQSGTWNIGTVATITNPVTVTATNLDIRDLSAASDTVTIYGSVGVIDQFNLTTTNPAAVAIVDGNGDQITSFGGGTQYATNVAYADGDIGTLALTIRDDALSTLTEADGDYSGLRVTSVGRLWTSATIDTALPAGTNVIGHVITDTGSTTAVTGTVAVTQSGTWNITNISGTISLPTGASTLAEQQTQTTSLQLIDDTIVAQGTALGTTKVSLIAGSVTTAAPTFTNGNINQLSLTTSGALRVDLGATSANSTAIKVDGTGGTFPISGTVAVTQSTSPWIVAGGGTAGSAATGVVTVQGIASMTPVQVSQATASSLNATVVGTGTFAVQVDGAALTALQLIDDTVATLGTTTYTEAATKGNIIGAVRRDANTTLVDTTNEVAPLQVNATGELKVAQIQPLPAGTNAIGKLAANDGIDIGDVTINNASGGSAVNIQDGGNSITVDYATTGSGTSTGALRVELPTNGTGTVGLNAGTNAIGKLAANSGVDIGDVDVTSIAAGTNNIGQVSVAPQTANGLSVMNATSSDGATALTNSAQVIKASAGQLYGYFIYNPNSSAQFVQFYNTAAASVTVGTTNPLFMLTIPATSAANVEFTNGITFSNAGWSWAATSTAGGNGAPSTALDAVCFYK